MSVEDSAIWLVWCAGFLMGFAYRIWGERRAARHDPVMWQYKVGRSLAYQCRQVEQWHQFTGDETGIVSESTYRCDGKDFTVRVERSPQPTEVANG